MELLFEIVRILDQIYLAFEFKFSLTNNIEDKRPPGSFKNKMSPLEDRFHEYQLKL